MRCDSRRSQKIGDFTPKISIHFRELKNVNKPPIFVFPALKDFLDRGTAEFDVPEGELLQLTEGRAASA
jgi:hypothetical protein